MSDLLVDTHALIWAMTEPERLSPPAEELLADPDAVVWVSAATAWEIATKVRIGKLPGAEMLVVDYAHHLEQWFASSLPVDAADSLLAGTMEWAHRDPFDRMIAAQAMRRGLVLISADVAFDDLSGLQRTW